MKIIDAHTHLWLRQDAVVDGKTVRTTHSGRSHFMGEERQMLPPFMIDGQNTAEVLLSNMDYAQVSAAVVTQEFIDGNQNKYLSDVQKRYPERFCVFGLSDYFRPGFAEHARVLVEEHRFRGMSVPGHRLKTSKQTVRLNSKEMMEMFGIMDKNEAILSLCLSEEEEQITEIKEVIRTYPKLKIAVGHFGMVTGKNWDSQIELAHHPNVFIELGGTTWLFNHEFYPFPSAIEAICQAIDRVGADKLMWGSDYPRTITAITYRMSYDFILKSNRLTLSEKECLMHRNAQAFYGFGELTDLPYIKNMSE
ncbi:MAG: amidohydrolase [Mediterranea sp.]|jgi:predicted TIM-barrel fold metal-dependent hydrolase|nr:amidohydrolase [Mediterranea sp.]